MSLATIVQYAQTIFEGPASSLVEHDDDLKSNGTLTQAPALPPDVMPRAGVPSWLRHRRPDTLVITGHQGWRIDGEVEMPLPDPNVDAVGPDALAFYVPFHMYRQDWGIYIRSAGVKRLACILKGAALVPGDERFLHLAHSILLRHEMWHAATEIVCTRAEMLARQSLYRDYFVHEEAGFHEEALANAHAFWWASSDKSSEPSDIENLAKWMRRQGPGYRDFERWGTLSKFTKGRNAAVAYMTDGLPRPKPTISGSPYLFLYKGALEYPSMPVRYIVDDSGADASIVRAFPREHGLQLFVYSCDHDPPHFHVRLLDDGSETRYLWPTLTPYEGDRRLTGRDKKAFDRYWERHEHEVVARVRAVYPHALGDDSSARSRRVRVP